MKLNEYHKAARASRPQIVQAIQDFYEGKGPKTLKELAVELGLSISGLIYIRDYERKKPAQRNGKAKAKKS